jgi:glycosyltransferase involved in cell wall biosynthesis
VIEAQAAGLPVVGIQSPGVGDIIQDGVNGLLAQEEDLAIFTAKLVRLVTDQEELQRMKVVALKTAQEYSYERTSQLLLEHYQHLINIVPNRDRSVWQKLTVFIDDVLK